MDLSEDPFAGWMMAYSRYGAHVLGSSPGDKVPDDPQAPDAPVTWRNVGIAALLLAGNVALSMWFHLGLSRGFVVAAIRCVVQLTLLGMVLEQIFSTENPVYIFGMTLVLGILAAFEVTYWRSKWQFPWMYTGTLVAITGSTLLVGLFGNAYALNMDPAYTAVKFIPTIGMLFGKCMIGVSIGMGSVMDSLDNNRSRVETALCFGSSRWEATKPIVVEALRAAMLPTITNMSITGLISIPGMMTGWVLGGASVLQAARYQQIILFMISASTASSTLLSVLFCAFMLVDRSPRLRLDRLSSTSKLNMSFGTESGRSGSVPHSETRMERLRSTCRPASEILPFPRRSGASLARASISGAQPASQQRKQSQQQLPPPLKPSKSTSLLKPPGPVADIEDAAAQCRRRCGARSRTWHPCKEGAAGTGHGDSEWEGNWCACCPLRERLQGAQQEGRPVECYGFHEDPGDITIPHPPALLNIMPGSSATGSAAPPNRSSTRPPGKTKPYTKPKHQSEDR